MRTKVVRSDTFEIAPEDGAPGFGRDQPVLEIFMEDRPETRRLYQAYQRSNRAIPGAGREPEVSWQMRGRKV